MSDAMEAGRQVVREMCGEKMLEMMEGAAASEAFCHESAALALKVAFGEFWARPGLDRRSRSLVTMGMLMGLRLQSEFRNHVHIALNNGITVRELEEVVLHAIPYIGFASAAGAISTAAQVIEERGLTRVKRVEPHAGAAD